MRNPKCTRTCAGCGKKADKSSFLRIGRRDDGTVGVCGDGRGAYICKRSQCLEAAVKKKRISSILRCAVPNEVYEEINDIIGSDDN